MKAIQGGNIYIDGHFVKDSYILFDDGIVEIGSLHSLRDKSFFDTVSPENRIVLNEEYVVPGFIDVHIHGAAGFDTMDATEEALTQIAQTLPRYGVTGFLATTMTMPADQVRAALQNIRNYIQSAENDALSSEKNTQSDHRNALSNNNVKSGARILGVHLEGPFISTRYCGAQPKEDIRVPSEDPTLIESFRDIIKVVTIAPEIEGAMKLIEDHGRNICFSLGHSECDMETAKSAFEKGAKSVTHLFNAMTPLHHRKPGLVGASFLSPDTYAEIICDNIHIHPSLYPLILRMKGHEHLLLITDCMRAGGLSDGTYELGGQDVRVKNGQCTLADGTIAGSVLGFSDALKHFVRHTTLPLEQAIRMTSYNQAHYLNIFDQFGTIEKGKKADFTVLDHEFEVVMTIVDGKVVYRRSAARHDASPLATMR